MSSEDAAHERDARSRSVATPRGLSRSLARHPSGILLAVQLSGLLLYPLMEDTPTGRALFGVFGILALSLVLWVVSRSAAVNWIAWVLAAVAVTLSLLANVAGHPSLMPIAYLLESLLYFYAAASLIFYMLGDHRVTTDELVAAATTFTLLAWAFTFAFSACQAWAPASFGAVDAAHPRSWMELLFLSFGLLSGAGLSDIVPATPVARALTMLGMFCGVMYIAVVVSRLIALTVIRQQGAVIEPRFATIATRGRVGRSAVAFCTPPRAVRDARAPRSLSS